MHLFDIDIPGKQKFKESDILSPGDKLLSFDTSQYNYLHRRNKKILGKLIGDVLCYPSRLV